MLESKGDIERTPHVSLFLDRILAPYLRVWPASGQRSSVCSTVVGLDGAGGSGNFQATAKISEDFSGTKIISANYRDSSLTLIR